MAYNRGMDPRDRKPLFSTFVLGALAALAALLVTYSPALSVPSGYASSLSAVATAIATDTAALTPTLSPTLRPTTLTGLMAAPTANSTATPAATATAMVASTATVAAISTTTVVATSTATAVVASTATAMATPTGSPALAETPASTQTSTPTTPPAGGGTVTTIETATSTATVAVTGVPTATTVPTATGAATATPIPTKSAAAVPNDDIDSATLITSFPLTTTQDTSKATGASDDPNMGAGAGANSNTVWYRVAAPGSGSFRVNTFGSSYDTVLAAFTGSRGNLSVVASNDDANSSTYQSEVAFNVQTGTTYYLEVAQYGDAGGGALQLSVEYSSSAAPTATPTGTPAPSPTPTATYTGWYYYLTPQPTATTGPAPSNDDIGSATTIDSFPFASTIDTTGATVASDDPGVNGNFNSNSNTVWYRLVASSTGSVRASTLGSSYDTVLAVFTGSRGSLTLVASNDDANSSTYQSEVAFNVQAGTTYYLEVAQYGTPAGGSLTFRAEWINGLLAATPTVTPGISSTPGALATAGIAIPGSTRPAALVQRDARYFPLTGYRINLDPFWDYFNKRGGVRTFGYPISWEFSLFSFKVQLFQRGILQLMPNGSVATMNLLDEGLMPYTRINFSAFPGPEQGLMEAAPSPSDPLYGEKAIAFLNENVPDEWEGMPVGFLKTFLSTVRYEDAFPNGEGAAGLLPLFDLEMWGLPTSRPAHDPNNRNFVYQRFQRAIMMYDASDGTTQGLLLADYLKNIMTGQDLPADLEQQATSSRFYRQYEPRKAGYLARPAQLPGTNLEGALEPQLADPAPAVATKPALVATPTVTR